MDQIRASLLSVIVVFTWVASVQAVSYAKPARHRNQSIEPTVVAIVSDSALTARPEITQIVERVQNELDLLLKGTRYRVVFPPEKRWVSEWDSSRVRSNAAAALNDPDVDIVLGLGFATAIHLTKLPEVSKPVLIPLAPDPRFSGSTLTGETSGRKNLAYLSYPGAVAEDLKLLKRLTSAKRIHILLDASVPQLLPRLGTVVASLGKELNIPLTTVIAGESVAETLQRMPPDIDALYVAPQVRLSGNERKALIAGLNKQGIPTFSMRGRVEVNEGMLATKTRGTDLIKIARRTAFNLEQVLRGEDPGTFPCTLKRQGKLLINMQTARTIGFSPTWDVLNYAEVTGDTATDATPYTLRAAVDAALKLNWDLQAAKEGVAAQRMRSSATYSDLAPQIDFEFSHKTIRQETAEASLFRPQHQGRLVGSLSQTIYREPVYAAIGQQKSLLEAQQATHDMVRLDVIAAVATAFIDLLRAQSIATIRRANADLSAENLERSKVRRQVGVEGPSDYYRWKSKLATDRRTALDADTQVEIAQVNLARVINLPQNQAVRARSIGRRDPTLVPAGVHLYPYLSTPASFSIFSEFVVKEGRQSTPDLKELASTIAAKKREYQSRYRALFLPELFATGEVGYAAYRSFAEAPGLVPEVNPDDFRPPAFDWFIGLGVSLPIFTGLRQSYQRDQAERELRQLQRQLGSRTNNVEARVRTALAEVRNRSAAIALATTAAEAGAENLRVVQDSYSRGVATTIDLLDAQNEALTTQQTAATAVNDFHIALIELQRAMANFELFTTAEERSAWLQRLREFFAKHKGQSIQ